MQLEATILKMFRDEESDLKPSNPKRKRIPKLRTPRSVADAQPGEFINREISWLQFNSRVLAQAQRENIPLLERLKFLGIVTSNLDEFFMKRVGGLKQLIAAGLLHRSPDGKLPSEQLTAIRTRVKETLDLQAHIFTHDILPKLKSQGLEIVEWADLSDSEKSWASEYFNANLFPILTPMSVDLGHPFPFISNLSISLGILLVHPQKDERHFARIKVPPVFPQLFRVSGSEGEHQRFIRLREIIANNLHGLFPGMNVVRVMPFRVTRNAEVELDELDAEDLLELIEEQLRERKFSKAVRLEHCPNPDPWMLHFLRDELELKEEDVYEVPGPLDYTIFKPIVDLKLPNLKDKPWVPVSLPPFSDEETNLFSALREGDLLVHHPYESFTSSVERFLRTAVEDPKVLGIKMTLYRTGDESTIIPLLIRAAEMGKQVVCLVELRAYFDEARNIAWAQTLEKSGVHVVYGVIGLKTHCKTILVIRNESDGVRCYAHLGTGNYNPQTAKHYTDLGYFTADPIICADLVEMFHYLTGRSLKREYRKLLVAPINMKERFLAKIEGEIENKKNGKPARIAIKINNLEDHDIIRALYRASRAKVDVSLIVRSVCCLHAGVENLSDKIKVFSVLGRFLEHSRIFHFAAGAEDPEDGEFYIGSSDWMYRNLENRVEVVVPITDKHLRHRLWEILNVTLTSDQRCWEMIANGSYQERKGNNADSLDTQEQLMRKIEELARQAKV